METEVILDIKVGTKFKDLQVFEDDLKRMSNEKFVHFYKNGARTIQSAIKNKTTRYLNPALKFYAIRWCCVHGGRKFQTRGKGIRKTRTLRREDLCPAYIQIRVDESGDEFVVVDVNFEHNHLVTKALFNQLPHIRRNVSEANVKKIHRMKANKHTVKEEVEKRLNQTDMLDDLKNLYQDSTCVQNNMQTVSDLIQDKFGADCHVLVDENNIFKGLFFASPEMIDSLAAYPEIIFIDAKFTLLAIEAPVYIISNIDGNGESSIIAVSILMSEEKESLQWFLKSFRDSLPPDVAPKIENVMTDKDFPEREILRTIFPGINLHLCVSDVLNIFRREITCEQFKIKSSVKVSILDLLQKLVYSKLEKDFCDLIEQIKNKSVRVYNYLIENWVRIKDEWCPYLGEKSKNFMIATNNRLESIISKLEAVIDRHSCLEEFINTLAILRDSLEKEKFDGVANVLNKRHICTYHADFEYEYLKSLTPFAFEKLKTQFLFKDLLFSVGGNLQIYHVIYRNYQLQTTSDSCTCYFHKSMGLPCKHIFAVRQHMNLSLFEPALVLDRWKMKYLMDNCYFLHQTDVKQPATPNIDKLLHIAKISSTQKRLMTSQEKYQKTFTKAKLVATLSSDLDEDQYHNVNTVLDAIINDLQNGKNDFVESALSLIKNTANDESNVNEDDVNEHFLKADTEVIEEKIITSDISQWNNENVDTPDNKDSHYDLLRLHENNDEFDINNIKVSICKTRERLAGSNNNATEFLKRRRISKKLVPFSNMPAKEQVNILLGWLLRDLEVAKKRKVEIQDLLPTELIDIRILEADTDVLKKFFSVDAWKLFKGVSNHIKTIAKWRCYHCESDIGHSEPTIRCDFCLHWFHIHCAGTITDEKSFMCENCK